MSINYELAKQLKDTGFPQLMTEGQEYFALNGRYPVGFEPTKGDYERVYIPNLPELIEACGEGFETLTRARDDLHSAHYYWATASTERIKEFSGDTPEEAVAMLWLALNKQV